MRNAEKGFTLIELMITVAIVGILAAIAYPSYTEYVMRSRRVEGQNLLNDAAARQERFRAQNGVYAGAGELDKLKLPTGAASQNGYYTLTSTVAADGSDGGFTLKATRAGAQVADRKCGDFTLNAKGTKGMAADSPGTAATCWR
ncbi:type IV pilin protein [Variovorax paradoxus]|uniref:type IV pilin protein n=1 Tax=Variovorax paradoxus TaxID=34073 RepID=UPI003D6471E5